MPASRPRSNSLRDVAGRLLLPSAFVAASALAYVGGGFQRDQWGPFAIAFGVVAALVVAITPIERSRLGGRIRVATFAALGAYVVWTAIGIRWSPNGFAAHEEFARTALYGACIVVGVVGSRYRSAVQAGIVAWMVATCAVTAAMLLRLADHQDTLFAGGRMLGTLTYHNGEAALLVLPIPAALALAALRTIAPEVRALLVAGSAMLAMTAVLPQSRGAMIGLAVALVVTVALSPTRTRLILFSLPVAGSVAVAWPRLNAVYTTRQANPEIGAHAQIDTAVATILGITAVVAALVVVAAMLDRARELPRAVRRTGSALVALACVAALVAAFAAVPAARSPIATVKREWNAAVDSKPTATGANADTAGRFAQLGNNSAAARVELWRVALHDIDEHPVRGIGPNNYEASFYQHREQMLDRYARQPHQLTLEVLAERGIVGAILLGAVLVGILVAAIRARVRVRSQRSKALIAGLLGTCAYWFAHAQLDWIWQLGALTVPAALAAGCLLGTPWRLGDPRQISRPVRALLAAAVLVPVLVVAPVVLADRHASLADDEQVAGNADEALEHARVATRWAPHWSRSWQVTADAHEALGHARRARQAARRSVRQDPEHWASHVWLADFYDRIEAYDEAIDSRLRANDLNPLDPDLSVDQTLTER